MPTGRHITRIHRKRIVNGRPVVQHMGMFPGQLHAVAIHPVRMRGHIFWSKSGSGAGSYGGSHGPVVLPETIAPGRISNISASGVKTPPTPEKIISSIQKSLGNYHASKGNKGGKGLYL